jgi:hypothetical protein
MDNQIMAIPNPLDGEKDRYSIVMPWMFPPRRYSLGGKSIYIGFYDVIDKEVSPTRKAEVRWEKTDMQALLLSGYNSKLPHFNDNGFCEFVIFKKDDMQTAQILQKCQSAEKSKADVQSLNQIVEIKIPEIVLRDRRYMRHHPDPYSIFSFNVEESQARIEYLDILAWFCHEPYKK